MLVDEYIRYLGQNHGLDYEPNLVKFKICYGFKLRSELDRFFGTDEVQVLNKPKVINDSVILEVDLNNEEINERSLKSFFEDIFGLEVTSIELFSEDTSSSDLMIKNKKTKGQSLCKVGADSISLSSK